ncbi:MAG: nicotinate-nicotinamide nucleotide adenylyltransferase [Clostridia bacterium]|nr:nicotinate-nicotinamide nucleotide adenylyltransferase [Clostridia bacterium]
MSSAEKIGIYGGTFAPPHEGHVRAAHAFLAHCALDTLYIIPTAISPHKPIDGNDHPADRLAMCRLAFSDAPSNGMPINGAPETSSAVPETAAAKGRIIVSDYEQQCGGKSYTIFTLEHFRAQSEQLYLLCGTDMFLTLDTWYRGSDILSIAKICCLLREDSSEMQAAVQKKAAYYRDRFGTEVLLPAYTPLVVSSSEIRLRIRTGKSTAGLLSPKVRQYINEHHLYTEVTT